MLKKEGVTLMVKPFTPARVVSLPSPNTPRWDDQSTTKQPDGNGERQRRRRLSLTYTGEDREQIRDILNSTLVTIRNKILSANRRKRRKARFPRATVTGST